MAASRPMTPSQKHQEPVSRIRSAESISPVRVKAEISSPHLQRHARLSEAATVMKASPSNAPSKNVASSSMISLPSGLLSTASLDVSPFGHYSRTSRIFSEVDAEGGDTVSRMGALGIHSHQARNGDEAAVPFFERFERLRHGMAPFVPPPLQQQDGNFRNQNIHQAFSPGGHQPQQQQNLLQHQQQIKAQQQHAQTQQLQQNTSIGFPAVTDTLNSMDLGSPPSAGVSKSSHLPMRRYVSDFEYPFGDQHSSESSSSQPESVTRHASYMLAPPSFSRDQLASPTLFTPTFPYLFQGPMGSMDVPPNPQYPVCGSYFSSPMGAIPQGAMMTGSWGGVPVDRPEGSNSPRVAGAHFFPPHMVHNVQYDPSTSYKNDVPLNNEHSAPGSKKRSRRKPKLCFYSECTRLAQQGGRCIAHGGGRRCSVEDCSRSAQKGRLCARHGGKRLCVAEGCEKYRVKKALCLHHLRISTVNRSDDRTTA